MACALPELSALLARTQGRCFGSPCPKSNIRGDPVRRRPSLDPTGSGSSLYLIVTSDALCRHRSRSSADLTSRSPPKLHPLSPDPASRLCLICLCLHSVLRKQLIHTAVPLKGDAAMVRWLLGLLRLRNLQPGLLFGRLVGSSSRHGLCAKSALFPFSVCLRPFYTIRSSSAPSGCGYALCKGGTKCR